MRGRALLVLWWLAIAAVTALSLLPAPVIAAVDPFGAALDKVLHGGAYFVLALLPGLLYAQRRSRLAAAAAMILLGGLIEALQILAPGRAAEWLDLLADTAGAVCGWVVAELFLLSAWKGNP
ncbi:MAG: VanZ family protein [Acidobacteria bacterium]|nr:VanZ family protein [Acidobacteriota bacterium]MBI3279627.1 VanZ family protein [Acidobacteriota bacterium]